MKQPPVLAKWLLGRFAPCVSDSLVGDLQEEYEIGRSDWWYWRQVLNAIFVSTGRVFRHDPLQAVLAISIGWGVLWIYFSRLFLPFVYFDEELFARAVIDVREWWPHHTLLPLVISFLGFVTAGWSVGQCHRREIVLGFATTVFAWNVVIFTSTLYEYKQDASVVATMALHYFVFIPVSILIGGIAARSPRLSHPSQVS